ncbi:MAG: AraC family transcriptional regulator [Desulfobacterales bacterium]|jgi:AraC-like DNA-binding protein
MKRPNNQTILNHRQRAQQAMVYIDQNLDQVCPIDRLAQEVCRSPFHFNRVFAGCTGETLKQYWVRNRMLHAAHCLMHGNRKIIDIAMDIGYESHNAFSKAFRKWYGLSPRAFRDRSINIDTFEFTFAKLGPFPPTYSPAWRSLGRLLPHKAI